MPCPLSYSAVPPDSLRAADPSTISDGPPPHRFRDREELLASTALGGQLKRVGPGRWTAAAEGRFFDELAATTNVKRACAAAGVSTNAVYARRMKRADFRAKWDAVLETGRAAIEMHLVESAKKTFDPDALDLERSDGAQGQRRRGDPHRPAARDQDAAAIDRAGRTARRGDRGGPRTAVPEAPAAAQAGVAQVDGGRLVARREL